jgi:hypothetical protein
MEIWYKLKLFCSRTNQRKSSISGKIIAISLINSLNFLNLPVNMGEQQQILDQVKKGLNE